MPDFSKRSSQPELMDTEKVSYEEFAQCLRHLEFINHCTLAYRPTLKWLKRLKPKTILDIGSGGGDMMRKIWRRYPKATITGVDMNPYGKHYAETRTPDNAPLTYVTHTLFNLCLKEKPDVIISSLFTHHLKDDELVKFIKWMDQNAAQGWFINDLHRHAIAYYFIKAVTAIFPFNRFVKHDAAVSVARSFKRHDWMELLNQAGIGESRYAIRWHFPFRYCVACKMQ